MPSRTGVMLQIQPEHIVCRQPERHIHPLYHTSTFSLMVSLSLAVCQFRLIICELSFQLYSITFSCVICIPTPPPPPKKQANRNIFCRFLPINLLCLLIFCVSFHSSLIFTCSFLLAPLCFPSLCKDNRARCFMFLCFSSHIPCILCRREHGSHASHTALSLPCALSATPTSLFIISQLLLII